LPAQDGPKQAGPGDAPEKIDQDTAKRWKELKEAAGRYTIGMESDPPVTLTLLADPALRWNNPLRVAYDGALFLWVAEGRPEVAASFYRYKQADGVPIEKHEFTSLSTASLKATYEGKVAWSPRTPGVAMKPVPGAPKPAPEAAGRLRQMRALAREFRAKQSTDTRGRAEFLRQLTQPLFRYETSRPELLDGALFAFVEGTDPEVLLLFEARPVDGTPTWHYAFARMSGRGLHGWHKDQLVWQVPPANEVRTNPYMNSLAPVQPH
jgi:hypothetical protein